MTNDFRHDERLLAKVSASAWDVAQRVTLEIEDYLFEQEEEDRETLARQLASQRNGKEAE